MTTRGKLLRGTGTQNFHGQVHKWKREWVFMGDENTPTAKKRIKLLKWVQTEERAETVKGPKFPRLIPVDKEDTDKIALPPKLVESENTADEKKEEDQSTYKNGTISTGDFLELGFNDMEIEDAEQTEMKSSEISERDKTSTDHLSREPETSTLDNDSESGSLEESKESPNSHIDL